MVRTEVELDEGLALVVSKRVAIWWRKRPFRPSEFGRSPSQLGEPLNSFEDALTSHEDFRRLSFVPLICSSVSAMTSYWSLYTQRNLLLEGQISIGHISIVHLISLAGRLHKNMAQVSNLHVSHGIMSFLKVMPVPEYNRSAT